MFNDLSATRFICSLSSKTKQFQLDSDSDTACQIQSPKYQKCTHMCVGSTRIDKPNFLSLRHPSSSLGGCGCLKNPQISLKNFCSTYYFQEACQTACLKVHACGVHSLLWVLQSLQMYFPPLPWFISGVQSWSWQSSQLWKCHVDMFAVRAASSAEGIIPI